MRYIKYLKPEDYYPCPACQGTGKIEEIRDLHRSGGIAPCRVCSGGTVKQYTSTNPNGYDYKKYTK